MEFTEQSSAESTLTLLASNAAVVGSKRSVDIIELHRQAFLEKIKAANLSEAEYARIERASVEMVALHSDQEARDDGLPYCCHPFDVAGVVVELFSITDPDTIIAALFHDSFEDQLEKIIASFNTQELNAEEKFDLARQMFTQQWGQNVSDYVTMLTNPNYTAAAKVLQAQGDVRELQDIKHDLYHKHVLSMLDFPSVFAVKMADFSSNALNVFALPESPQKHKLLSKYTPVILSLVELLNKGALDESPQVKSVMQAIEPGFQRYLKMYNDSLN